MYACFLVVVVLKRLNGSFKFVAEIVCSSGRRAVVFARHMCNINTYYYYFFFLGCTFVFSCSVVYHHHAILSTNLS